MTYRPSGQSLVPSSSENKLKTGVRETIKANFIFLNLKPFFFFFFSFSVFYGEQIFQRLIAVTHHLTGPDGDQLTRRPYRIAWFMNQLSECV